VKPRRYSSDAIILSRKNYGEADRFLTVYSKNFGKLRLLAKGVRRPKSKKRGHIEVFSQLKFSASKGKGIDLITEAETIASFEVIRKDLKKVTVAYFLLETIRRITHDEEKNEELYNHLLETLTLIKKSTNLRKLRYNFIYKTLILLGFWPVGKVMIDPDKVLTEVIERQMFSVRVGKKLLT